MARSRGVFNSKRPERVLTVFDDVPFLRLGASSSARCSSSSACMAASVSCLISGVRIPSLPVRLWPSRKALRAASISKGISGLDMCHCFRFNDHSEMTQIFEHCHDTTNDLTILKTDTLGRREHTNPEHREAWLDAFEQTSMSGAAFARLHGIRYTTFAIGDRRAGNNAKLQTKCPKPSSRKSRFVAPILKATG